MIRERVMKCPACQAENREGAKFCKACGSKTENKCPSCGHRYEPKNRFCDECGCNLRPLQSLLQIDTAQPKSYTPEHLIDKILTTRSAIEGERKIVTVLFADVVNFSAITEKLDPEEVHTAMDGCFKILMDRIHSYEGTINQFTGDGVMALFGAPIAHENHAQRACYSVLSIQRDMAPYREKLSTEYGVAFDMRFGINSGLVMVGAIGNDLRMDYTAVGNTTILANRLESEAKPGHALLSENTYRLVKAYFKLNPLGSVALKGFEKPQKAYELIGSTRVKSRIEESIAKGIERFVNRETCMATLKHNYRRATQGKSRILGIIGEPGVGKSRILLELKRSIGSHDTHFLEGRCLSHGQSIAYLPFLEMIKRYLAIEEGDRDVDKVAKIKKTIDLIDGKQSAMRLSAFMQLLSLEGVDEVWRNLEPKERRQLIFKAIGDLFIILSKEKQLVMVVDDLQWMDKTSEAFLDFFIDAMTGHRILLCLLYRPEYSPRWKDKSNFNQVGLDQLTKESSAELISAILEDAAVAVELEQVTLQQSAGNPLFIEEFIYSLLENHYIEKTDNEFRLARRFNRYKIPDTLHGIVMARVDRLDATLKRIIQIASVMGENFQFRILQAITGERDDLASYLDDLVRLEFIVQKETTSELVYTFKHILIQEAVYSSLLRKKRIALHAQIGLVMKAIYSDNLDQIHEFLAHHFLLGEDYPNAYEYLKRSSQKAESNFSHVEAFDFLQKALNIFDNLPDTSHDTVEELGLYNMMRRPLAMLGFPKGSLGILNKGALLAETIDDRKALSRYHNDLSLLYTARGDSSKSIAHGEKSFQQARKIDDIDIMAPLSLSLCYAYVTSGRYDPLIDTSLAVIRLIEKDQRQSDLFNTPFVLYAFLAGLCGTAMGMKGDFHKGRQVSDRGLDCAVDSDHLMTLAFMELQYANLMILMCDGERAIAHCQNSIRHSEAIKWPTILCQAWTMLGNAHYLLGDLNQAQASVTKGLKIQKDTDIEAMMSLHYCVLTMIYFDQGAFDEALRCSEKALTLSQSNNEKRYEGMAKIWTGKILGGHHKGRFDEGEKMIREGCDIFKKMGLRPALAQGYFHLGEVYGHTGKNTRGVDYIKRAKAMFVEMNLTHWIAKTGAALKNGEHRPR